MTTLEHNQRNCFLISPIGDSGSDIRKAADELFELIIIPALKPYNFKILRADKVIGANIITNDIINLVQNSELCIIDLTGSNPNVFYECGRRHETGKPFIQLIRSGEKLPFDVASIRTIDYDLSSARSAQETIGNIQLFIEDLVKTGFTSTSSGFSLSSISSTLERIERRLESISGVSKTFTSTPAYSGIIDPVEKLKITADPLEGLKKATETGDLKIAQTALQILYSDKRNPLDYIKWCIIFAGYGDKIAFDILKNILADESFNYTSMTELSIYIVHIYNTFSKFRDYETGYKLVIPKLLEYLDKESDLDSETRYLSYDIIALFSSGVFKYQDAIQYAEKALTIKPSDEKVLGDLIYYYDGSENIEKSFEVSKKYLKVRNNEIDNYTVFESVIIAFYKADAKKEGDELLEKYKKKFPTMYDTFIPLLDKTLQGVNNRVLE